MYELLCGGEGCPGDGDLAAEDRVGLEALRRDAGGHPDTKQSAGIRLQQGLRHVQRKVAGMKSTIRVRHKHKHNIDKPTKHSLLLTKLANLSSEWKMG